MKFAGCYHGHSDALLASAGSGVATLGRVDSAGVPAGAVEATVVAPYNAVPLLDERVACVIVEPVAANMGLVAPAPGFLAGLRRACDEVGALLVFDEVISGFRIAPGCAAARFGVQPDLYCLGKVVGGGLPLAAVAGAAAVMELLAPVGPVYQAGTLAGNPLATAAGLAVLELLGPSVYDELERTVARLAAGIGARWPTRASPPRCRSVPRCAGCTSPPRRSPTTRGPDAPPPAAGTRAFSGRCSPGGWRWRRARTR